MGATLRALFRARVTAGMLVILPIYVTWLVVKFVFSLMRDASLWVVAAYLRGPLGQGVLEPWQVRVRDPDGRIVVRSVTHAMDVMEGRLGRPPTMDEFFAILPPTLQWSLGIVAVLLTIVILYSIGLLAANMVGRRVIDLMEALLDRVPLVKTVYRALKQIITSLSGDKLQDFKRVVLVPFPDSSMRAVGFVTRTFRDSVTQEELCTVFIATTPNPTTGYLQYVRRGDVTDLNWTVEEAVRTVMSGGVLSPAYVTILQNKDMPPGKEAPVRLPLEPPESPDRPSSPAPGLPPQRS
jgi:uncharacterized membrane protein